MLTPNPQREDFTGDLRWMALFAEYRTIAREMLMWSHPRSPQGVVAVLKDKAEWLMCVCGHGLSLAEREEILSTIDPADFLLWLEM